MHRVKSLCMSCECLYTCVVIIVLIQCLVFSVFIRNDDIGAYCMGSVTCFVVCGRWEGYKRNYSKKLATTKLLISACVRVLTRNACKCVHCWNLQSQGRCSLKPRDC